jgi:hypothetical protein
MKKTLLLISAITFLFLSCEKPIPTHLTIHFTHTVDGVPLELTTNNAELPYTNAAGQNYNIKKLQYLIWNIDMHSESGNIDLKDVHFVDAADPSTLKLDLGELGSGGHSELRFNLGLPSGANISNAYVNEDFHATMAWPDMMGGGYHYMKLQGNFDNETTFYNTHTGPLPVNYNGSGVIINDHSISYSSGCQNFDNNSFYVSDGLGDVTITLNMELNQWYSGNNTITLTADGIMGNEQIQSSLKNNGSCIFSNSISYE